jgi:hypothetical protein
VIRRGVARAQFLAAAFNLAEDQQIAALQKAMAFRHVGISLLQARFAARS